MANGSHHVEIGRRLLWRFRLVRQNRHAHAGIEVAEMAQHEAAIKAGPQPNVAKAAVARIAKEILPPAHRNKSLS